MKRPLKIMLCILMVMPFFQRCSKILEEESVRFPVADTYYKTPEGMTSLVNSCYTYLRNYYGTYTGWQTSLLGTDIWLNGGDGPTNLGYYTNYTPSDATLWLLWSNSYSGITACNTVISRKGTVTGITEDQLNSLVGQAYFLRALYYHLLVINFGGVPLQLEEVTEVETTATRASEQEVYDQIIKDLLLAEELLPATQANYGRAKKPAAQALLARVYLWNNKNLEASTYAKKVINDYSFILLPDYADLWKMSNQKNAEIIWSVQYTLDIKLDELGNVGHDLFLMRYDLRAGMVRDIANGRPFRHYMPSRYFLNLLQNSRVNDSRYSKCFTEVWYANNPKTLFTGMHIGDTALVVVPYSVPQSVKDAYATKRTIYDIDYYFDASSPNGERTRGARENFPSLNKFLDPLRPSIATTAGSRDFPVLRLAEMYLIAAEALMKQDKADEGVTFINAVRRRAAWPGKQAAMEITAGQLTIDKILDERALELAGECVGRWQDLKRTGKLLERVNLYNPDARPNIKENFLLRPIPSNMIDRVSNKDTFLQNPGY